MSARSQSVMEAVTENTTRSRAWAKRTLARAARRTGLTVEEVEEGIAEAMQLRGGNTHDSVLEWLGSRRLAWASAHVGEDGTVVVERRYSL